MRNKLKEFNSFFKTLNAEQKEAVLSKEENLHILAGPGSGKTRVLTCRVAYMVLVEKVPPENIIVVTFTNKAANEMKERLFDLIGQAKSESLLIGTFHSLCHYLLRQYGDMVGFVEDFTIADTSMSEQVINDIRKIPEVEQKLSEFTRTQMKSSAILNRISEAKNKRISWQSYQETCKDNFSRDIAVIYEEYESLMQCLHLFDFDDLLIKCCELLEKEKYVLSHVQCILVDEYQDTNTIQFNLINLMMAQDTTRCLTLVGDPDQSIFSWRSAEPKNFQKMAEHYKNTHAIKLHQNYRSTGCILEAATHIIQQDSTRIDKTLFTKNGNGIPISLASVGDQKNQAEFVACEIRKIISYSKGLINYSDIAVLMRMNFISNDVENAFRSHSIPYVVVGGERFFSRVEVKDIISYLEFIFNPYNRIAFERVVNVPKRGVGTAGLQKIVEFSDRQETNYLNTIFVIVTRKPKGISEATLENLKAFLKTCSEAREMIKNEKSPAEIIKHIVESINYKEYLESNYPDDFESRWMNVGQLINTAVDKPPINEEDEETKEETKYADIYGQKRSKKKNSVSDFLEFCALCSNQHEQEEAEEGKVTIATLHSSKGLEWPCVFIVSCVEGVIPHIKSDPNEEKRLLYVGMTRSKFILYCVSTMMRQQFGNYVKSKRSSLFNGMDKELYIERPIHWNDKTRDMLAIILRKEKPPHDNTLISTRNGNFDDFLGSQAVCNDIRFGVNGSKVDLNTMGGFSSAMKLHQTTTASKQSTSNNKKYFQPFQQHKEIRKDTRK
ncbi:P-loop containing nucleoside triphosphate hydrolase protein [Sporodiniella umbellata]|nr:P-loop containing nucleoside triphosphate hydrolase protein [Sporodiniella umbellata]